MRIPGRANAFRTSIYMAFSCAVLVSSIGISGCGTPGAPQPPSLRLPEPVNDLAAERAGNTVTLHWTMPRKTTDHLLIVKEIHGPVTVRICRRETASAPCLPAGETSFAPGVEGEFHESLPASLSAGSPRPLLYFVELYNKPGSSGRSAGFSNAATIAAGAAPSPIAGLAAEVRATGVVLQWNENGQPTAVRLHRHILDAPLSKNPVPDKSSEGKLMGTQPEPANRDLFVEVPTSEQAHATPNRALDTSIRFGTTYEYTAQRILQITAGGKPLELAGEPSAPIRVEAIDTFPPAVPTGLAAVLVPEEKTIDLSWQPDTEEDLAGYIVYRALADNPEDQTSSSAWTRISGPQPVPAPAFRDTHIEPGHTYRYSVSAIDLTGHESKPSTPAQESFPNP